MNVTEEFEHMCPAEKFPEWLWVLYYMDRAVRGCCKCMFYYMIRVTGMILTYFVVCLFGYMYLAAGKHTGIARWWQRPLFQNKRSLFVIAHPDDECMFFGPTITNLLQTSEVYLLCLSFGNYRNEGSKRKNELYKSCAVLGIPQSNIVIMNDPRMPDDPDKFWEVKRTARILLDYIERLSIEHVYTFDIRGISGHVNHTSISYAISYLFLHDELPTGVRVFLLETVNKIRKFTSYLDVFPTYNTSAIIFLLDTHESYQIKKAMQEHKSQMVWYRKIYLYFSRYLYINSYKEMEKEDIQLVMQMEGENPFS